MFFKNASFSLWHWVIIILKSLTRTLAYCISRRRRTRRTLPRAPGTPLWPEAFIWRDCDRETSGSIRLHRKSQNFIWTMSLLSAALFLVPITLRKQSRSKITDFFLPYSERTKMGYLQNCLKSLPRVNS